MWFCSFCYDLMLNAAIDASTTRMMFNRVLHSNDVNNHRNMQAWLGGVNEIVVQKRRLHEEEMFAFGSLAYAIGLNFGSDTI